MGKITILKESKPTRCDICHKSDEFNPNTNYCSRCNNLVTTLAKKDYSNPATTSNFLMNRINQEIVIPNSINVEELGDSFTVMYRWYSIKRFVTAILPGISIFLSLTRVFFSGNELPSEKLVCLFIFIFYLIIIITLLVNKTSITISNNEICKKNGPIPFPRGWTFDLTDLDSFICEELKGEHSLAIMLKNGKRIALLSSNLEDDKEKILFIHRVLSERVSKKVNK